MHCYPSTETVMQMDKIWTFVAQFTVRPSGDASTADPDDRATGQPLSPSAAPSDSSSPSYFLNLADLVGPTSPTHQIKKSIDPRTPERAVHTILRRSLVQALDGGSAHTIPLPVSAAPVGKNVNTAQKNAASLLLSQHALWHLAEHVRTVPPSHLQLYTHRSQC